jgi:serine O-acetyltransferase
MTNKIFLSMHETFSSALLAQLQAALWECCSPTCIRYLNSTSLIDKVIACLMEDVHAFVSKDPAAGGNPLMIIQTYTSFKAVLHYRLANAMHHFVSTPQHAVHVVDAALYAPLISARGKMLSGAELHFKCCIGTRFVLDHGVGTVFGENSVIGDDCYVLGGVTLGASGISGNPFGIRHPTIGNRVQIGAFSRIFGPVMIGDDVFVGPHCTINEDVAARSRVTLRTSLQIVRNKEDFPLLSQVA